MNFKNRWIPVFMSVSALAFAQQKTYCNPINIDYGYTPFEVFSKQGKHRATAALFLFFTKTIFPVLL